MQHFYISQGLSELIPGLISPKPSLATDTTVWYGHIVPTQGGDFLVFMEDVTRYALIIHWACSKQPTELKVLFRQRLLETILELTEVNDKIAKRVVLILQDLCANMNFSVGLDYTISADLFDIACQLQFLIEDLGSYPIPEVNELSLALPLNRNPRTNGRNQQVVPLSAFQGVWRHRLGLSNNGVHHL